MRWLASRPALQLRRLSSLSPFTAAWISPASGEALQFESPADALRRLHARLTARGARVKGKWHEHKASPESEMPGCHPCGDWQLAPEGAAIHPGEKTAVIADVHLGYEWARGLAGDCVPAHSLAETLEQLESLLARAPIDRLVVAGDLVECPGAALEPPPTSRGWRTG